MLCCGIFCKGVTVNKPKACRIELVSPNRDSDGVSSGKCRFLANEAEGSNESCISYMLVPSAGHFINLQFR